MAVAGDGSKHVSGQTVCVDADQHIFAVSDFTFHESEMGFVAEYALESDHAEFAMPRPQQAFAGFPNEVFRPQPVADEICHRNQLHFVFCGKLQQIRNARHRSVFLHDFADHAGREQARTAGQVHGGFRLSRSDQHSAVFCAQRENVARSRQIARLCPGIDRRQNGLRTIVSRNAGGDTAPRFDGNAERRSVRGAYSCGPDTISGILRSSRR